MPGRRGVLLTARPNESRDDLLLLADRRQQAGSRLRRERDLCRAVERLRRRRLERARGRNPAHAGAERAADADCVRAAHAHAHAEPNSVSVAAGREDLTRRDRDPGEPQLR